MKKAFINLRREFINNYATRTEDYQGREHIIVPVTMMVEGVHSGNLGPILYTTEELATFTSAWNGVPVVVNHPLSEEGRPTSANIPDVPFVGRIFNAHMDGNKLKAEAWIDVANLEEVSLKALEKIQNQQPLQVSIGAASSMEVVDGEFNGESYIAISHNMRPDHLALLPDKQGACSWDDGCGIRNSKSNLNLNKKEGGLMDKNGNLTRKQLNAPINSMSAIKSEDGEMVVNEVGFNEISRSIQHKLNAMDTETRFFYLEEVFDSYFVYRVSNREINTHPYYKRSYQINDNKVVVQDDASEVNKVTTYPSATLSINNSKPKKEVNVMEVKKVAPCKIDALIKNEASDFTEDNREWLGTLEESIFDKLVPKEVPAPVIAPVVNKAAEKPVEKVAVSPEEIKAVFAGMSSDEFIKNLPPELGGQMKAGLSMYQEKREELIKGIVANSKFTEENLKGWSDANLRDLYETAVEEVSDYSLQNGEHVQNKATGNVALSSMISINKKTEKEV